MPATRTERIRSDDGHEFDAHLALPAAGSGPGMLVLQEIFGVNDYVKGACERLAGLGYVAMAPDLYSRIEPGVAIDERAEDGLAQAFGYMQRLDFPRAVDDARATLDHLRTLPEVKDGKAGVIGFCLGGGLAYFVAARSEPEVAVCYYGSAIPGGLDEAGSVRCPVLFHFGEADDFITEEQRQDVRAAFEGRPGVEFHLHPGANHAFDNHNAPMFHNAGAAATAWTQTVRFLEEQFPA